MKGWGLAGDARHEIKVSSELVSKNECIYITVPKYVGARICGRVSTTVSLLVQYLNLNWNSLEAVS